MPQLSSDVEKATAPSHLLLPQDVVVSVSHTPSKSDRSGSSRDGSVRGWHRRFRSHVESSHVGKFEFCGAALPFVRQFYGGVAHTMTVCEEGESREML